MDTKKRRRATEHPAAAGLSPRAALTAGLYDEIDQHADSPIQRKTASLRSRLTRIKDDGTEEVIHEK